MAAARLLAEERDGVLPHDLAGPVVFANGAVAFMAHEVMARVELARQASVAMRMGMLDFQLHLTQQFAAAVDLDDPRRARLGDHRHPIPQALKRMNLDLPAGVAVGLRRIIFPDDLLRAWIDF